jgi:hypothetical protein
MKGLKIMKTTSTNKLTMTVLLTTLLLALTTTEAIAAPFFSNRDWKAETSETHDFWGQPVCMASTLGSDKITRLEVIALASADGTYLEPLVQVVGPMTEAFLEISAESQKDRVFGLLPLYNDNANGVIAATALLKDREVLTNEIAQKSQLTAKYYDAQGLVKSVSFSLRGSSATLTALFDKCDLGFDALEETLD